MDYWSGMPTYNHTADERKKVTILFADDDEMAEFEKKSGLKITGNTIHYKKKKKVTGVYVDTPKTRLLPRYPVYIVSKGRFYNPLTAKMLDRIGCPYRIVVEPQEYDEYLAVINDPDKILTLPFSNLDQGSIPARNWIWEHSIGEGHKRHWILDDNISRFYRANNNKRTSVDSPNIIRAVEDFTDRYENIALSGLNYSCFADQSCGTYLPPISFNTRIYSMILIDNSLPLRWRGIYNEDTDLSLRVLKSGLCTALFNAFLIQKRQTLTMKGGNTDQLYQGDGRLKMAQSLSEQHPDVCTVTKKWGRYQHFVNYEPFKANKLKLKKSYDQSPNEYGLVFIQKTGENLEIQPSEDIPHVSKVLGKGYYFHAKKERYIARAHFMGKCNYLGSFVTEEAAKSAVEEFRKEKGII